MKRLVRVALCVLLASRSFAQDAPKVAGSDVPPPKRTRTVLPEYPAQAQEQGVHGIVILELTIDGQGKVAATKVIRSLPPLDDAAIAAVKKWEYEVTKVDGKPVSVVLTVPITFALRVPEVSRQDGIPELRQGTSPAYPKGQKGGSQVSVAVTLDGDGHIAEMEVLKGEDPWREALLSALRSWRFAPPDEGTVISFRVEAQFDGGKKDTPDRVSVALTGVRRVDLAAKAAEATPATSAPQSSAPNPPQTLPTPVPSPPAEQSAPAPAPAPTPAAAAPVAPSPAPPAKPAPTAGTKTTTAPPMEVLSVPPPRPSPPPAVAGTSALDNVALGLGVPDLTKGRRPVVPPFARMAGASGTVEVRFAVNAAGQASVLSSEGPELLKPAAEQAVASWSFRRTSAERLYLTAVFNYKGDSAQAAVAPSPDTGSAPAAGGTPAPPPAP